MTEAGEKPSLEVDEGSGAGAEVGTIVYVAGQPVRLSFAAGGKELRVTTIPGVIVTPLTFSDTESLRADESMGFDNVGMKNGLFKVDFPLLSQSNLH
mgnify:CR=1 FL=1